MNIFDLIITCYSLVFKENKYNVLNKCHNKCIFIYLTKYIDTFLYNNINENICKSKVILK